MTKIITVHVEKTNIITIIYHENEDGFIDHTKKISLITAFGIKETLSRWLYHYYKVFISSTDIKERIHMWLISRGYEYFLILETPLIHGSIPSNITVRDKQLMKKNPKLVERNRFTLKRIYYKKKRVNKKTIWEGAKYG